MARLARVVVPEVPHHVTQRGNRRQPTFFRDEDYALYLDLLAEHARRAGVAVWAYCLMPNHVHLILTPDAPGGLHRALAEAHRRYTRIVNARERWTGYLWQGRFGSAPMDEAHLLAAFRYVAMNPVKAGLCAHVGDWRWSSARAKLSGEADGITTLAPFQARVEDAAAFFAEAEDAAAERRLLAAETTGRPLGAPDWIERLERDLGRPLTPRRPGRKPRGPGADKPCPL